MPVAGSSVSKGLAKSIHGFTFEEFHEFQETLPFWHRGEISLIIGFVLNLFLDEAMTTAMGASCSATARAAESRHRFLVKAIGCCDRWLYRVKGMTD